MGVDQSRFNVNSLTQFQTKVWRNNFSGNRAEAGNFGIAARLGGSTVDFVLKGVSDQLEPLHVVVDLDKDDKAKSLQVLGDIMSFVAEQAKTLGQKVLPIDLGIAGFSTKSHTKFEDKDLPQSLGMHILPNFVTNSLSKTHSEWSNSERLFNFFDFASKIVHDKSGKAFAELRYQDEHEVKGLRPAGEHSFKVDFKVMNDTIAIGNSVLGKLSTDENVLTMVGGTGFNVGKLQGFNQKTSGFRELVSTEIGHEPTTLKKEVLDNFDTEFIVKNRDNVDPEWLFAGGNNGPQGIVAYANFLKEKNDASFQRSFLSQLEKINGMNLAQAARAGDNLAVTILTNYAKALGSFLNQNFKEMIADENTKNFVITGSHVLDCLGLNAKAKESEAIQSVRQAFETSLNGSRAVPLNLVALEKEEIDGLPAIVKARAAAAKLQA